MTTLLYELKKRDGKYGLATACTGVEWELPLS